MICENERESREVSLMRGPAGEGESIQREDAHKREERGGGETGTDGGADGAHSQEGELGRRRIKSFVERV